MEIIPLPLTFEFYLMSILVGFGKILKPQWTDALFHYITLGNCVQNSISHRMAKVGRNLWKPSGPTPCSSRDTQGRLPRTMSQWHLKISKEEDSIASLCSQCTISCTVKCFLVFRWILSCSSRCPLPLVLSHTASVLYIVFKIPQNKCK